VAGVVSAFQVTVQDEFGNIRTSGDDDVQAYLTGTQVVACVVVWHSAAFKYEGTYSTTVNGSCQVHVSLGAMVLPGSPFVVEIEPSACNGSMSVAMGPGLTGATAGEEASFTVYSRDSYGNGRAAGVDVVSVEMVGVANAAVVSATVTASSDGGHYVVTYTASATGEYTVSISIAGEAVADSTFACLVLPSALHSEVYGSSGLAH
jgi:hypothetical protein